MDAIRKKKYFKVNVILIGQFGDEKKRKKSVYNQNLRTFSSMFQKQHNFGKTWQSRNAVLSSFATSKKFRKGTSIYYTSNI